MHVDAETNHSETTSPTELLPDFRSQDLAVEPQTLLLERKVPLENHALFSAVPIGVMQELAGNYRQTENDLAKPFQNELVLVPVTKSEACSPR
jgi:hypothetical protein